MWLSIDTPPAPHQNSIHSSPRQHHRHDNHPTASIPIHPLFDVPRDFHLRHARYNQVGTCCNIAIPHRSCIDRLCSRIQQYRVLHRWWRNHIFRRDTCSGHFLCFCMPAHLKALYTPRFASCILEREDGLAFRHSMIRESRIVRFLVDGLVHRRRRSYRYCSFGRIDDVSNRHLQKFQEGEHKESVAEGI